MCMSEFMCMYVFVMCVYVSVYVCWCVHVSIYGDQRKELGVFHYVLCLSPLRQGLCLNLKLPLWLS